MALNHPDHPAPTIEGRCNQLLWRCKGGDCEYCYENTTDVECPFCGTKRRRCTKYPMKGKNSCRTHGGKALSGIDHPSYMGKTLSVSMPTRFLERFKNLTEDENELINQNEQLAWLKMRYEDLIARAFEGDVSLGKWSHLQDLMHEYQKEGGKYKRTGAARHSRRMVEILADMQHIILDGSTNEEWAWDKIKDVMRTIDKIAGTEMKRRMAAENVITRDQFANMMAYITNSVNTRVTNNDEKMAVLADIQKLFS